MLTDEQVIQAREEYKQGSSISDITIKYDINARAARNMLRGDTYKHLPGAVETSSTHLSPQVIEEIKARIQKPYRGMVKDTMARYHISYETYRRIRDGRA